VPTKCSIFSRPSAITFPRKSGSTRTRFHWVGVAVRESVANAIKHGNRNDAAKKVFVEFAGTFEGVPELSIKVRDQGDGFDPEDVADPLAPENLLKGSGRGIFLIRSFMDEMVLQRAPEGGHGDADGQARPARRRHRPESVVTSRPA
jgi:serine/threonine-protein kinase RsbW